jgi:prephenate dehydrogenase
MALARLSIIGVGLLGGSLGLAVKKTVKDCRIIGCGHRTESLKKALELGAIDEFMTDPAAAVEGADFVILATPVGLFESVLSQISPALKDGAIVTDVGSTKRSVVALAERLLPETVQFVGSHPMAGSEKRGVEFARADLFEGSVCIVTPGEQTHGGGVGIWEGEAPAEPHFREGAARQEPRPPESNAVDTIERFWQSLGMRIIRMSPAEHDRRVAMISHLPHAVAAALVAIQDQTTLALAGKGFTDATRIAAGDGVLWRDIFLDNADALRAGLAQLRVQLGHLEALLDPTKAAELKAWLDQIAETRNRL